MKPGTAALVVIDAKELTYRRYVGKTCTDKIIASEALERSWVETFRIAPQMLQIIDEPEVA